MIVYIKGHIEGAVNLKSRHATPRPFCHIIGCVASFLPSGILWCAWHKQRKWVDLAAQYKTVIGDRMHEYCGTFPWGTTAPEADWPSITPHRAEFYVQGHIARYVNMVNKRGRPFCGLKLTGAAGDLFAAALDPAETIWKDGDQWDAVDPQWKNKRGQRVCDPDIHGTEPFAP